MKVLLINNVHYRRGGADVVYLNTGEILNKLGHTVIFFAFNNANNIKCAQDSYFVDVPSKTGKGLNYFYNKQAALRLEQLIRAEKPDIAHLHLFWGGLTPSICIVLKKYNIPIVHTVHDYSLICPVYTFKRYDGSICEACQGKYFFKCIYKRCFKRSFLKSFILASTMYFRNILYHPLKLIDGFIFVSEFAYNKHIQYMPKLIKSNATVLYNFNHSTLSTNVGKSDNKYFLYYGRLSYEKGLFTLIKAFSQLKDITLKIVGTGPQEAKLKEVTFKERADNIDFVGYKSGEELKSIVSNAFFTIVPSEWYENNPMTVIESYSAGVPVIGTNVGGIPEIIIEGETGFLFEMKNVNQLIETVMKANNLLSQEYERMSDQATKYANDNFSKELYVQKLINFYSEVINKIDL